MKTIKIQPTQMQDFTLPYPYFIKDKGEIGRQDFWNGNPMFLIGFSERPKTGTCEVLFKDFWKKPALCVGKFPVFEDKRGYWSTSKIFIDSYEVINVKTKFEI